MSRTLLLNVLLLLSATCYIKAQLDAFALPNGNRGASKPTVPNELRGFFELNGHAKELIDTLMGPRPGGYFPEKTFDIASDVKPAPSGPPQKISSVERALENFFKGSPGGAPDLKYPPGFGEGFSLNNGPSQSFQTNKKPEVVTKDEEIEGSGIGDSSIKGIPKIFPKIPKAPHMEPSVKAGSKPIVLDKHPAIPQFGASRPNVPDGGFSSDIRRHPVKQDSSLSSSATSNSEYGSAGEGLSEEPKSSGGLIGTVLNLFGLGKNGKPADSDTVNKALTNLIGGNDSPLPAKNMVSNILYKALTSGSIKKGSESNNLNATEVLNNVLPFNLKGKSENKTLDLSPSQQASINENLEMIQNLIIQPSSPLCNPKPVPVDNLNLDAFMGQWYQVVYSPLFSSGACSMLSYKKLAEGNLQGVGSIFEIFEYTTDGTPYAKPKISSGYAILKNPGELIFRTSASAEDVNIHVIANGPINQNGEYEYTILSANCNYPIYVFARDPVAYKQNHEVNVNHILEKKGMVNGFSKLFNIVASVDSSMCTFPPSLFNLRG
uniref:Uncharacterized protein n=1 Tax=Rhabditophanes sp. KR3021 TaxID=114890 RepID=A0AC35U5B3_9BILA